MSTRKIGTALIVLTWIPASVLLVALAFEYSGASRKISRLWLDDHEKAPELRYTDYYGRRLDYDPYAAFGIEYLHPFYLFSLPWAKADRRSANNEFVNVDDSGFRNNPNLIVSGRRGVLLGGSAAFGYDASSDAETIGALLSKDSGIGFVNRNAPSWNSHQELVALAKYHGSYQISISYSLANDISRYCRLSNGEDYIPGEPESFAMLRSYFNDIRGLPLKGYWSSLSFNLFAKIKAVFPDTTRIAALAIKKFFPKYGESRRTLEHFYCSAKDVAPLVDSFLQNETTMRQLSSARGAIHVLVIQPSYGLHATSEAAFRSQAQDQYDFRRAVIAEVLKSNFCKEYCFDFSVIFDKFGGATHVGANVGTHYQPRMFINDVHNTDQGNEIIARELSHVLASLPIQ